MKAFVLSIFIVCFNYALSVLITNNILSDIYSYKLDIAIILTVALLFFHILNYWLLEIFKDKIENRNGYLNCIKRTIYISMINYLKRLILIFTCMTIILVCFI